MEINCDNFNQTMPLIERTIKEADFLSIDTEFSGLSWPKCAPLQYFDTIEERYSKLKMAVENFTLVQLGLACFRKEPNLNQYEVTVFNIYVFPRQLENTKAVFSCQTSSIDFLRRNGFDFNKFVYKGVRYMNKQEADSYCKHLNMNDSFLVENNLDNNDNYDDFIDKTVSIIDDWLLLQANREKSIEIDFCEQDRLTRLTTAYRLQKIFENRMIIDFDKLLTKLKFTKVDTTSGNDSKTSHQLQLDLHNELRGCARIFDLLSQSKKLIIGHNSFMDLMYMYEKFYMPLPEKYGEYKTSLHQLWPQILDTKHIISHNIRFLTGLGCKSYSLGNFYNFLHLFIARKAERAHVKLSDSCLKYANMDDISDNTHEAGFDAYLVGVIFLHFTHLLIHKSSPQIDCRPVPLAENLKCAEMCLNKINIVKSVCQYSNLDGDEFPIEQPCSLLVVVNNNTQNDMAYLKKHFFNKLVQYNGQMEIDSLSSSSKIDKYSKQYKITVGSDTVAQNIMKKFHKDPYFDVKPFCCKQRSKLLNISSRFRGYIFTGRAAMAILVATCFTSFVMYKNRMFKHFSL